MLYCSFIFCRSMISYILHFASLPLIFWKNKEPLLYVLDKAKSPWAFKTIGKHYLHGMSPLLLSGCNYSALKSVRQGSSEKFRDAHNCHKGVIRGVISEIDKWKWWYYYICNAEGVFTLIIHISQLHKCWFYAKILSFSKKYDIYGHITACRCICIIG